MVQLSTLGLSICFKSIALASEHSGTSPCHRRRRREEAEKRRESNGDTCRRQRSPCCRRFPCRRRWRKDSVERALVSRPVHVRLNRSDHVNVQTHVNVSMVDVSLSYSRDHTSSAPTGAQNADSWSNCPHGDDVAPLSQPYQIPL
uniref:Secreted protein n=1 Tax=Nelumbo nucifera TaxID=4432 RepID=A0A822Z3Q0_NELNU|nr:TPA_asm: hypothetical protein HUJ06_013593 [Nelumbo nucifera]